MGSAEIWKKATTWLNRNIIFCNIIGIPRKSGVGGESFCTGSAFNTPQFALQGVTETRIYNSSMVLQFIFLALDSRGPGDKKLRNTATFPVYRKRGIQIPDWPLHFLSDSEHKILKSAAVAQRRLGNSQWLRWIWISSRPPGSSPHSCSLRDLALL